MDLSLPGGLPDPEEEAAVFRPRRGARVGLRKQAQLRSTDQNAVVVVCDLSTGGFMAECLRPVLIGSYVSLDVPGIGPVNAQVRWQVGTRLGARFLDPVGLHRCEWTSDKL